MVSYLKSIANAIYQVALPVTSELLNQVPVVGHFKMGVGSIALGATLTSQAYFAKSFIKPAYSAFWSLQRGW